MSGLEKFGNTIKEGAFYVGRKIKDAAVGGYDYVKENDLLLKVRLRRGAKKYINMLFNKEYHCGILPRNELHWRKIAFNYGK